MSGWLSPRRACGMGLRLLALAPFVYGVAQALFLLNGWWWLGYPTALLPRWILFLNGAWTPQSPSDSPFFYGTHAAALATLNSWPFAEALLLALLFFFAGPLARLLNPKTGEAESSWSVQAVFRLFLQLSGAALFLVCLARAGSVLVGGLRAYFGLANAGRPLHGWLDALVEASLLLLSLGLMAYAGSLARAVSFSREESSPEQPGFGFVVSVLLLWVCGGALGVRVLLGDTFSWSNAPGAFRGGGTAQDIGAPQSKDMPPGFKERVVFCKPSHLGPSDASSLEPKLASGFGPGVGPGQLSSPRGLAVAPNGDVYVADFGNSRISVFDKSGAYRFCFGAPAPGQGKGGPGQFDEASGVAVGPSGTVYVADAWDQRIEEFGPAGNYLSSLSGPVLDFYSPRNVAVDGNGVLYVADTGRSQIKIMDKLGSFGEALGGLGTGWGQLQEVFGVAIGKDGSIYAADPGNRLLHKYSPYPGSGMELYARVPGWAETRPNWPGLAVDARGTVYVTDGLQKKVFLYDQDLNYLETLDLAGLGPSMGIAAAPDGGVWVSDFSHGIVMEYQVPPPVLPPVDVSYLPYPIQFPAASLRTHALFPGGPPKVRDDFVERRQFLLDHDKSFWTGDFAALDREADACRRGHLLFDNGDSRLVWLYSVLASGTLDADRWAPSYYQQRLAQVDRWEKQFPGSITAKLCRAQLLLNYAWISRGAAGGLGAQGVVGAQAPTLTQVWALLDEIATNDDALNDPEYYCLRIHAGYGMDVAKSALTSWYSAGLRRCPKEWELAHWYSNGIAPKWNGGCLLPVFFQEMLKNDPLRALYVAACDQDSAFPNGSASHGPWMPWDKYAPDRETYWDELGGAVQMAITKYGTSAVTLGRIAYVAASTGHYGDAAQIFRLLGWRHEESVWEQSSTYSEVRRHCLAYTAGGSAPGL